MIFLEKLKESSISVLPIMALVSLLHFALAPLGVLFVPFLLGGILIIAGLSFFLVGADIAFCPWDREPGLPSCTSAAFRCCWVQVLSSVHHHRSRAGCAGAGGAGHEVAPSISGRMLVLMIAAGVGFFVSVALLRVTFQVSLRRLLALFYALLFLCAAFSSRNFLAWVLTPEARPPAHDGSLHSRAGHGGRCRTRRQRGKRQLRFHRSGIHRTDYGRTLHGNAVSRRKRAPRRNMPERDMLPPQSRQSFLGLCRKCCMKCLSLSALCSCFSPYFRSRWCACRLIS